MKKQLFNVLKIVVSAGLIIYMLVYQVNVEQLWQVARRHGGDICWRRWC